MIIIRYQNTEETIELTFLSNSFQVEVHYVDREEVDYHDVDELSELLNWWNDNGYIATKVF